MSDTFIARMAQAIVLTSVVCTTGGFLTRAWAAQTSGPAAAEYVEAIDALEQEQYGDAATSVTRALEQDPDNQAYVRARGVALTLAEDFPAALRDLQRATRLDPRDQEAKLWLAAAQRMSGDFVSASTTFSYGAGNVPNDYAELVLQTAMEFSTSKLNGEYFDLRTRRMIQTNGPERRLFPEAANWYARRNKPAGAGAAQVLTGRVAKKLAARDFAGARRELLVLLQNRPDDLDVHKQWLRCLVGLTNALEAREEATYILGVDPLWSEGYLLRAEAAAHLGDARRAEGDLRVASAQDAPGATAARRRLAPLLGRKISNDAPAQFLQKVDANTPWDELVGSAIELRRWSEQQRTRYDEEWQERLRLLAEARQAEPKSADAAEALARYYLNTGFVPGIWNGPRGEPESLRRQSTADQQRELRTAISLCDEALKLNPKHPNALATKARTLSVLGAVREATAAVQQALSLEPDNVSALRLKSRLLEDASMGAAYRANALRTGHTEIRYDRRSDGTYRVETYYEPSAAQQRQASVAQGEAANLRREANAISARASLVTDQKIPALLQKSRQALEKNDLKTASANCRQALRLWPDNAAAQTLYSEILGRSGQSAGQRLYAMLARPYGHSSTAGDLKRAWTEIERTAFKSAEEAITAGLKIDPTDARLLGCRSVVAEALERPEKAERYRQGALALEEARARARGTSFHSAATDPVAIEDIGLTLLLTRQAASARLGQPGDPQRLLKSAEGVTLLEKRLPPGALFDSLPSGMLPDPTIEPGHVQQAPSVAEMFAWAHLRIGQAHLAAKRTAEARREFEAVQAYSRKWPVTREGRETLMEVVSWAMLLQAQDALGRGDLREAERLARSEGFAATASPDFLKEIEKFQQQLTQRQERDY